MEKNNLFLASEERLRQREAQTRLAGEVEQLLSRTSNTGSDTQLCWAASGTDLMEALHHAYDTGLLTDQRGNPMSYRDIVRRACRLLHVKEPLNPYDCAARGRRRKGVLRRNYFDRYCQLLSQGQPSPFLSDVMPAATTED